MKSKSLISTKIVVNDKELVIELIQKYLNSEYDEREISNLDKYLSRSFSKFLFTRYAKTELILFGTTDSGLGENPDEYEIFREKACELFNKWFVY